MKKETKTLLVELTEKDFADMPEKLRKRILRRVRQQNKFVDMYDTDQ